jgi:hypothetical protein
LEIRDALELHVELVLDVLEQRFDPSGTLGRWIERVAVAAAITATRRGCLKTSMEPAGFTGVTPKLTR